MIVEVGLPVKQGLKQVPIFDERIIRIVEVGLPVKQGLKLFPYVNTSLDNIVEVGLPVKQGLKRDSEHSSFTHFYLVEVGLPKTGDSTK